MISKIEKNTDNFTRVPIAKDCLDKMKRYAYLAGPSEIYGFILANEKVNDGVARYAMLCPGQQASGASVFVDDSAIINAKSEIEQMGCKAIGFWHSHGNFGVFHSGTDDGNMNGLVSSLASSNEVKKSKSCRGTMYVDRENGTIVYRANGFEYVIRPEVLTFSSVPLVRRQPNPAEDKIVVAMTNDREFRIRDGQNVLKIPDVIEVSKRDILPEEYKAVGAAYSVVVNRYGKDYAELGLTKWCSVCEREETEFVKDVKLKVLGDGACSFSDEVLIKDLEERVVGFRRKNGRKIF